MSIHENKLKEIANAIRVKDGTTAPIPANEFADRILAIKSGGGSSDFAAPLNISTLPNAVITATNGSNTVTATANSIGIANLILNTSGKWTITGELNAIKKSVVVYVSNGYTCEIDLTPLLPNEYTKLEYIESISSIHNVPTNYDFNALVTGQGFIPYADTTNIPLTEFKKSTFKLVAEHSYPAEKQGAPLFLFGIINDTNHLDNKNTFGVYIKKSNIISQNGIFVRCGTTTQKLIENIEPKKMIYEVSFKNSTVNIDGNIYTFSSLNSSTKINTMGLFMCRRINSSDATSNTLYSCMKLYKCDLINENGVYLSQFIPCIENLTNKPGLYDLIREKFYTTTSGEFIAGPVVEE